MQTGRYFKVLLTVLVLLAAVSPAAWGAKGAKAGAKTAPDAAKTEQIPAQLLQRPRVASERGLYVTNEAALAQMKTGGAMLVDVRAEDDFRQYRIPGSINLPLFAVKTKPFLKGKDILLINEGDSYPLLEQACREIRQAGIKASIVQGGLNTWRASGHELEGDLIAARVNRLCAARVFEAVVLDRWVILNIADTDAAKVARLFPEALAVPYSPKGFAFGYKVKGKLSPYQDPSYCILLVDEQTDNYAKVEGVLREAGYKNVYCLEGGRKAYEAELMKQAAAWRGDANRTVTVKKCQSCP